MATQDTQKQSLDLASLRRAYSTGISPSQILEDILARIASTDLQPVWISLVPQDRILARAREIENIGLARQPLYGIPFAVKDNIDVAGLVTTAGCPAYSRLAEATATVVSRLEDSGAILVGKTNMDQFATGLVGVRSPYGSCASVFDPSYISGGSSSGSAVAVAAGLVTFALGTDTAGSGRVPAAFNNLIGFKPTRGLLSASGVVPACRSLDCVSIFALTCSDALSIFETAQGEDAADPYSRALRIGDGVAPWLVGQFRYGTPFKDQLQFFGDSEAERLYAESGTALERLGGAAVEFDFQPFLDTAALLYDGPWVAERRAALGEFLDLHFEEMDPIVRGIIRGGEKFTAIDAFRGRYRLEELRKACAKIWRSADVILLPTTGTIYTHAAVEAEPLLLNSRLGYYTNFVNLLDLAAVAVPGGFRVNGLPFGVTLMAPAGSDVALLTVADRLHRQTSERLGASDVPLQSAPAISKDRTPPGCTLVAVVGAHLTGQPLNRQLTSRAAVRAFNTRTAPEYRLFALPGTVPPKPALTREPGFAGPGIEVEVWAIPTAQFGAFVAEVPPPLGIGTIELADRSQVKGFVCESHALAGAAEITHFGGWRAYRASL